MSEVINTINDLEYIKFLQENGYSVTRVIAPGDVCEENSSIIPLEIDEEFAGEAINIIDVAMIFVNVFADEASATDGLHVEQSPDGTNWDSIDYFTISANTGKTFSFQPAYKWFRVHYINGGVKQTAFRLHVVFKRTNAKPSSHRIQDSIVDHDDAELVKAIISAKSNGEFTNLTATYDGNLKVANVEDGLSIAKGLVSDTGFIHKFGGAPDYDAGDLWVTAWDGADDGGIDEMQYIYSSGALIDSLSSDDTDDAVDIEVQGLDVDWNVVVQTITLDGFVRVALTTALRRVFRLKNVGAVDLEGNVYCFEDTADTGVDGIPDDTSKIRAVIQVGNNQTTMAIFTIPANQTGYMRNWYASLAGTIPAGVNVLVKIFARPFGQVFQLKHESALSANGTSSAQHTYKEPEIFTEKTDIEIRVFTDKTDTSTSAGFDIVLVDN